MGIQSLNGGCIGLIEQGVQEQMVGKDYNRLIESFAYYLVEKYIENLDMNNISHEEMLVMNIRALYAATDSDSELNPEPELAVYFERKASRDKQIRLPDFIDVDSETDRDYDDDRCTCNSQCLSDICFDNKCFSREACEDNEKCRDVHLMVTNGESDSDAEAAKIFHDMQVL
jgi:hypothetical protein